MTVYSSSDDDLEVVVTMGPFRVMSGQEDPMLELEALRDLKANGEALSNCSMMSSVRGCIGSGAGSS